jgi:glycerate 2-kinase
MRVLIAPDKFKGTLTAAQASRAIATGWRSARPDDAVEEVPLADGGEGTLDAILAALGGRRRRRRVRGPLGEPVTASYGVIGAEGSAEAVVESSLASGLQLVAPGRRDPLRATSWGTGELIGAAATDARQLLVCLGGSATNDAGAGMAHALGIRFLDDRGRELGPGGAALLQLAAIDTSGLDASVRDARVVGACDVDNPLVGPTGATAVYGPQKGARPEDVELLERALTRFADVVKRDVGIDVGGIPGAGSAGGLGAALVAFLGADLRSGTDVVMEMVGFAERLERADLVVTGEGSLDAGSLHGKVPVRVAHRATEASTEVLVLCGRAAVRPDGVRVESLVERFGEDRAMADPRGALRELAAAVAASW